MRFGMPQSFAERTPLHLLLTLGQCEAKRPPRPIPALLIRTSRFQPTPNMPIGS